MRNSGQTLALFFSLAAACWLIPLAAAQEPDIANFPDRLRLDDLLRQVELRNPGLRAAHRELDAARLRISPAGALPDPMLTIGEMSTGSIRPLAALGANDMSRFSLAVSQEIPLFGKRALRERLAISEAYAASSSYDLSRLQLLARAKSAYYDFFLAHRRLEVLQKSLRLLQTYAETAEAQYRVGEATQADVFRAQTEQSRLAQELEVADQLKASAAAQLNALLNQPSGTPLPPPAEFERGRLEQSFDELLAMARERYPVLLQQNARVQSAQLALRLAEKESYPDLDFMFGYHNRGGLKDLWEISGTLRIPLYRRRKQDAQIQEAAARVEAAQALGQDLRAAMEFELKDRYLEATTAARLLSLLQETIIPQETLALEATAASYRVGRADFPALLETLGNLIRDELRYYEHLAAYQKALAQMEPLVGIELTAP